MSGPTRRSTLAALGTALAGSLAGCSALRSSSEGSAEYDESAIRSLPGALPSVPGATPVQPTAEHVVAARERVRSLLDGADVSSVPNGVVRHRLAAERDAARDGLVRDDDESRVDALAGLTYPRSEAMFVAAGLAAFDGDLTADGVAARRERHHGDATAFLDDYQYAGPPDDPVAALAEHATIADWAATGARLTKPPERDEYENAVLHVAERAQGVEWGRAYAADARRLHERYTSTLEEPHDHGPQFGDVAETLVADVEADTTTPDWDELGSEIDRDLEGTAGESLLEELASIRWSSAQYAVAQRDAGRHPGAIVAAMRALAADDAFAAATTAITDGEYGVPESIDPIAAERAAAVDGLETLLDTAPALLARRLAPHVRSPIRMADENARQGGVTEPGRSLYARYAIANRLGAAAPAVVQRVGDAVGR